MIDIRATGQLIDIGRYCENEYRRIIFDVASVLGQYPDATFTVLNQRATDTAAYPVPASQIAVDGTDLGWTLKAADLAYTGEGSCEVIAYSGETVAKSMVYTVRVRETLDEGIEPPEPWEDYLDDLSAIADRAETAESGAEENALKSEGYAVGKQNGESVGQESPYYHGNAAYFAGQAGIYASNASGSANAAAGSASAADRSAGLAAGSASAAGIAQGKAETAQGKAEDAQAAAETARDQITGMSAEATTLDPGESATASYSDGVLTLGIPRGADGEDGQDGADGYSPAASVSKSGTTATITITDKDGTTTASISDGADGQDGQDGHTPVRGTDYWTAADQAAVEADVEAAIGTEISALKSEIDRKAPAVMRSASGDIVSFEDGADGMPLKACTVQIDTVQAAGTPTPSDPLPISGWTGCNISRAGKNLLDDSIRSLNAAETSYFIGNTGTYTIPLKAGTYTLSAEFLNGDHYGASIREKNDSGNTSLWSSTSTTTSATFTLAADGMYRIWVFSTSAVNTANVGHVQLECGSAVTEYQPYQGQTYAIDWQTAAGTVYGGTLDTVSGVLTVDRAKITLTGEENWQKAGAYNNTYYAPRAALGIENDNTGLICNMYAPQASIGIDGGVRIGNSGVMFTDSNYATKEAFAAYVASLYAAQTPIELVAILTAPQTYQLTAAEITTLLGQNNVWADTGAISLTYAADTETYISEATDPDANRVVVSGSTPSITGESGKRYICGTLDSLSITPPGTGIIDVVFTSGTTPTVLTVPNTVVFPAWFDATSLDASTTYEINIQDGVYGAVMAWT